MIDNDFERQPIEILRKRAERLAVRGAVFSASAENGESACDYLYFDVDNEKFAIETSFIKEIRKIESITPIPCTPAWMSGVVSVRGHILQVIDMGKYFGLNRGEKSEKNQLVVMGDREIVFCILAEHIHGVRDISDVDIVRQQDGGFSGAAFCQGITGERIFVINAKKFINDPGLEIDEEVVSVPGVASGNW